MLILDEPTAPLGADVVARVSTSATGSAEAPALVAAGMSGSELHDVDLDVAPGEILGLAGIEGNGQSQFLRALAGLERAEGAGLGGEPPRLGRRGTVVQTGLHVGRARWSRCCGRRTT